MLWKIYSIEYYTSPNFACYMLPRENEKSEGKSGKTQMAKRTVQSKTREKQKSNGNPGWQDGGNMTDINCRIKVYIKYKL